MALVSWRQKRIRSEFETSLGYITRPCLKKKTKKKVSFTLLVQIYIKYLLYTELQNRNRKTEEGLRDLEEALRTMRGCRTHSSRTHRSSRTKQSWDLISLTPGEELLSSQSSGGPA